MEQQQTTPVLLVPERKTLPIEALRDSKLNHRAKIKDKDLAGLAQSIQTNGIIQALVVRDVLVQAAHEYQVVCGNRRWRAAILAGLTSVPADVYLNMPDDLAREFICVENLQREDLHPMDEAEGLVDLAQKYPDFKVLAAKVGKEPKWVRLIMQLVVLDPVIKKKFREDAFSLDHAIELARLPSPEAQREIFKWIMERWQGGNVGIGTLRDHIRQAYYLRIGKAPFPIEDPELVKAAGSCVVCPKRSGENPLLFPDIQEADTCTDAKCYQSKVEAHIARARVAWGKEHPTEPLVTLSSGWQNAPKGVLNRNEYEVVMGAKAKGPEVMHGIIMHGQEDFGKTVAFVKRKENEPGALSLKERKTKLEGKEKEIQTKQTTEEDLAAVPVVVQAIRSGKKLELDELQFIAIDAISRGYHDMLVRACKGMKLTPAENQYHVRDYSGALEANVLARVKDEKSLLFWLLEYHLYHHVGSSRDKVDGRTSKSSLITGGNPIHILAARRKVNLKETWATIHANFDQRRQRAQKRLGFDADPVVKPKETKKR
jgi:ParB/RepB/Spo0J family partition protein